jgi:hypothetical protein
MIMKRDLQRATVTAESIRDLMSLSAAAGRESTHYPCRSPRVTARLLRALRERGDDVRARRARWTF